MEQDREDIRIGYQQVPSAKILAPLQEVSTGSLVSEADAQETVKKVSSPNQKLDPHPNSSSKEFDFHQVVMQLSFKLNLEKAQLTCEQEARLIDIIYNNKKNSHFMTRILSIVIG